MPLEWYQITDLKASLFRHVTCFLGERKEVALTSQVETESAQGQCNVE